MIPDRVLAKLDTEPSKNIPAGIIKAAVIDEFHIEDRLLHGRQRDFPTSLARQSAMYLIYQMTDMTLAEIGNELGGRTPSTVSWGYRSIAGALRHNPKLRRMINKIQEMVNEALAGGAD